MDPISAFAKNPGALVISQNTPPAIWQPFVYRFNRRFQLDTLPKRLFVAAIALGLDQTLGFGQLKHLANQVKVWEQYKNNIPRTKSIFGYNHQKNQ